MFFLRCCLVVVTLIHALNAIDVDPNGYVVYCPCMGRFGNQAEQFLGALSFVKNLDRTLILPPWVEYKPSARNSIQVPFDTYFKVSAIAEYHPKVITMEKFMRDLAPIVWPPEKRKSCCHSARGGGPLTNDCNAKEGNPFGPFWDTFNIDFTSSQFHQGLSYDSDIPSIKEAWEKKFPVKDYMVIAMTGAPAAFHVIEKHVGLHKFPVKNHLVIAMTGALGAFPVSEKHVGLHMFPVKDHLVIAMTGAPGAFPASEKHMGLHMYLQWSNGVDERAEHFIENNVRRPFIGLHFRNGVDWKNACRHSDNPSRNLFGSAQCLGYRLEHGQMTEELCLPSDETVIKQVKAAVKKVKAEFAFVAADERHMIPELKKAMKQVTFVKLPNSDPHLDLAILGRADHYIGNCVSTFSHFATRERRAKGLSVEFWAFKNKTAHTEL